MRVPIAVGVVTLLTALAVGIVWWLAQGGETSEASAQEVLIEACEKASASSHFDIITTTTGPDHDDTYFADEGREQRRLY